MIYSRDDNCFHTRGCEFFIGWETIYQNTVVTYCSCWFHSYHTLHPFFRLHLILFSASNSLPSTTLLSSFTEPLLWHSCFLLTPTSASSYTKIITVPPLNMSKQSDSLYLFPQHLTWWINSWAYPSLLLPKRTSSLPPVSFSKSIAALTSLLQLFFYSCWHTLIFSFLTLSVILN